MPYDTEVLIVGAGPTGLALAGALAHAGVSPMLIDRQPEGANTSRAAVVHARTLERLSPLGVDRRLIDRGLALSRFSIRDRDRVLMDVDFSRLPTEYPFVLMIPQFETERVLLDRFQELGGTCTRPASVVDLRQDADGVVVSTADGRTVRARYVVGADGMHSVVREKAGIRFAGGAYSDSFVLADVRLNREAVRDQVRLHFSPGGMVVVAPLPDHRHRIVAAVEEAPEAPTAAYIDELLRERGPRLERLRVTELFWGSRFRVHHRVADHYRSGRVFLAGDAAHVHSPAGGQGMNIGIQDGVVLAGALADLLATGDERAVRDYEATRRPVARRVVRMADRLTRLATMPRGLRTVRNTALSVVGRMPSVRDRFAYDLAGLSDRAASRTRAAAPGVSSSDLGVESRSRPA